ncbi:MAG: T9SS type A sorting domain-containing protein [Paludibacter sp.]|nr:T9SS type A sorting domain-containing protein [Paludibacter sp.]
MKTKNYSKMEELVLPSGGFRKTARSGSAFQKNLKKLFTLMAVIALTSFFSVKADLVKNVSLAYYDFTTITTSPFTSTNSNLATNNVAAPTIPLLLGQSLGYLNSAASGGGGRGTKITNMTDVTARMDTVYYEFDWNPYRLLGQENSDGTSGVEPAAYGVCIVRGANDSIVFGLMYERWSHIATSKYNSTTGTDPLGDIHLMNISTDEFNPMPAKIVTRTVNAVETSYYTSTLLPFAMLDPTSASYYAVKCDSINKSTNLGASFKMYKWYHIKAAIDFKNKNIISFEISEKDASPVNKKSFTNLPFVNNGAADVSRLEIASSRGKAEGTPNNGANCDFAQRFDNFDVYTMHEVAEAASVTVRYKDANGVEIKDSRVASDQEVGTKYHALATDKVTIELNDEFYLYDETTVDSVTVASGGSELVLNFIKATPKSTVVLLSAPTTAELFENVALNITIKTPQDDIVSEGYVKVFINGNYKNMVTPDVLGLATINCPNLLVGTTEIKAVYIGDRLAYNSSDTVDVSVDITPSTSSVKPYPVYFDLCDQPEIVEWNRMNVTSETPRGYGHTFTRDSLAGIIIADTLGGPWNVTYYANGTTYDKIDNCYNHADQIQIPFGTNRPKAVTFKTPWLNEGSYNVYLSHRISSGSPIYIQSVTMDDQEAYFPEGEMVDRILNSYNFSSNHRRRWNAAAHGGNLQMNYLGSVRCDMSGTHMLKIVGDDSGNNSLLPLDMLQFIPVDQDSVSINETAAVSFAKTYYPLFSLQGVAYMPDYDAASVATTFSDFTNLAVAYQVQDQTDWGKTYETVIDSIGIITRNILGEDFVANYVTVYKAEDKWTRVAEGYSDDSFNFTCNLPEGNYYYEMINYLDLADGLADYRDFINSGMFTVAEPNAVINTKESNIRAYSMNSVLTVKGITEGARILVTDLTGKLVLNTTSTSNVFTKTLQPAIYIVRVASGSDILTTKVIVR